MHKYFCLQFRRLIKLSPYIFLVTLAFLLVIFLCGYGYFINKKNNPENQKIQIGIVGESDIKRLQMGFMALENFDETKHIFNFQLMSEKEAITALNNDDILAYLIFPDTFIDNILAGNVKTVSFVTKSSVSGLDLLLKEEFTKAVSVLLEEAQKGVYGIQFLLDNNGFSRYSLKYLNEMNIEYISFIINRNLMYEVEEIGVGEKLNFIEYIISGLIVFLLMLFFLPFTFLFTQKDYSLNQLLQANGISSIKQILSEAFALTTFQSIYIFIIFLLVKLFFSKILPALLPSFIALFFLIFLFSCFTLFICEISGNILNSIILQFLLTVFLCYISGCFYPIFTMPKIFQQVSCILPTGRSFRLIAALIESNKISNYMNIFIEIFKISIFSLIFLFFTVFIRDIKIKNK